MPVPAGVLFDLEGTIYQGEALLPGARELLALLDARAFPVGFVTNTTSRSRAMLVARLGALGIAVRPEQVTTAPRAARRLALDRGWRVVAPFLPTAALEDLDPLVVRGGVADMDDGLSAPEGAPTPDAVIVGDLGARWSFSLLQEAFTYLQQGAALITCSRDRYYRQAHGLVLDAGPFTALLEYATSSDAVLAGKPSAAIFAEAVASLGVPVEARRSVIMVGDDLRTDVGGARDAGLTAWAVRTGKFAADDIARYGIQPDRVLATLGEFPADGLD
jgi:HAD superfamily hydrolase (TIGR01458 family)